jgi:hypothetical protein
VVGQVKAGVFWPPAEKVTYDDYACLALGRTLEETINVGGIASGFATRLENAVDGGEDGGDA